MTSLILLSALWWLLAGVEPASWLIGAPAIGTAWCVRRRLKPFPPWRADLSGAIHFLLNFLTVSLVSGIDVVGLKGTAAYADHAWILGQKTRAFTLSSTRPSPPP